MISANLEGYLSSATGQGAAGRLYAEALDAAGVPVTTTNVEIGSLVPGAVLPEIAEGDRIEMRGANDPDVNVLCVNGLELGFFAAARGVDYFQRPTIGVWGWETDYLPEGMRSASGLLREVWTYSDWVGENLRPTLDVPIATVSPPVLPPRTNGRLGIELPNGFLFLFIFDLFSTMQRKNPLGLISAYRRAFEEDDGTVLVLKTMNGARRWESKQALKEAAAGRSDIVIIDRLLEDAEKAALYQRCDCYVSLHRAEGFGITAAEAMLLGKPVIATGYSGTRQFMTPENSFLVDHQITTVGPGVEVYPAEGHWAEPDLDHAARLMREVRENPEEARRRGEEGRRTVEEGLSPAAVGRRARERLEAVLG